MADFEMIKYHNQIYQENIPLRIEEIAAHFDITGIKATLGRSLHTEYSYGKRKLNSKLLDNFPVLVDANKDGVPQLWKSCEWADAFASFIIKLNGNDVEPNVIEIHPPFNDYTDMDCFIKSYSIFENKISAQFPNTNILIENRSGSIYHGGNFLLSNINEVEDLCDYIMTNNLKLKIALDIPQIYTAYNASDEDMYLSIIKELRMSRSFIGGVHLWGKRCSVSGRKVSHCGDLNSYFGNQTIKEHFLEAFLECFDDDITRKMVLEVNSGNDDLSSIVSDLLSVGVDFV